MSLERPGPYPTQLEPVKFNDLTTQMAAMRLRCLMERPQAGSPPSGTPRPEKREAVPHCDWMPFTWRSATPLTINSDLAVERRPTRTTARSCSLTTRRQRASLAGPRACSTCAERHNQRFASGSASIPASATSRSSSPVPELTPTAPTTSSPTTIGTPALRFVSRPPVVKASLTACS
jgi:hypothetical protein